MTSHPAFSLKTFAKDTLAAFVFTLAAIIALVGMDYLAGKVGGWGHLMILITVACVSIVAMVAYTYRNQAHR